jgi:hypothetical protein
MARDKEVTQAIRHTHLVSFYEDDTSTFLFKDLQIFFDLHPTAHSLVTATEPVFTDAKSWIINPRLYQRRQFCPDFLLVWIL